MLLKRTGSIYKGSKGDDNVAEAAKRKGRRVTSLFW